MESQPDNPFGTRWSRLDGVDLLRGLAILLVLLNHVNMRLVLAHIPYGAALPPFLLSMMVWNGQTGVQIFFAISGFLITATSIKRWRDLSRLRPLDFYRIRFARIAPLLMLVLLLLSVLDLIHVQNYVITSKTGGLHSALWAALTFRLNVLEARHGYLPGSWDVLWSLSVEETFYVFFPLISRFLGGRKPLFVAALLTFIVLGPVARAVFDRGNGIWYEYSYLGGMDAIALGSLTALILSEVHLNRHLWRLAGLTGFALVAFSLAFRRIPVLAHTGLHMSVVAIGTCLLIVASASSGWKSPSLLRPLSKLGQCSYETYLTHMFIVFALFDLFLRLGSPAYAILPLFVTTILAAGLLGTMTARLYSEPINRGLRARWQPSGRRNAVERSLEIAVGG
jgi:peptidoglycan/LPS O-acetylase OafA/YrhL